MYRKRVRDYLEAGEYLEVGDSYAGTSDITLTRPAHKEKKEYRVETKNTKLSLFDDGFIDEFARQFVDYSRAEDGELDFIVFAVDYADQSRWKDIFHDRIRKKEEVMTYYEEIVDRHGLKGAEKEEFDALDFRDFWRFLERVSIKKAGYERLGELITDRESQGRSEEKWAFFTSENEPIKQKGELLPNFVRIIKYPDHIWTLRSLAPGHQAVFDQNPRHLPIWIENGQIHSLIPPEDMPDSLEQFVDRDTAERSDFAAWARQDGDQHHRRVIGLLNRQVRWRGVQRHERCTSIYDGDGGHVLIITRPDTLTESPTQTRQQTLSGELEPTEGDSSEANLYYEGYVALKDWGSAYPHRYGRPIVKRYGDYHYVFVETGWVFTERGRGHSSIGGDRADELHKQLDKNTLSRNPNHKSQFRQWRTYLGLDEGSEEHATIPGTGGQLMSFEEAIEVEFRERPPKNSAERKELMFPGGEASR